MAFDSKYQTIWTKENTNKMFAQRFESMRCFWVPNIGCSEVGGFVLTMGVSVSPDSSLYLDAALSAKPGKLLCSDKRRFTRSWRTGADCPNSRIPSVVAHHGYLSSAQDLCNLGPCDEEGRPGGMRSTCHLWWQLGHLQGVWGVGHQQACKAPLLERDYQ